jgi:hypothetical protein
MANSASSVIDPTSPEEILRTAHQLSALLLNVSGDVSMFACLSEHHQSGMLCLASDLCLKIENGLMEANHG